MGHALLEKSDQDDLKVIWHAMLEVTPGWQRLLRFDRGQDITHSRTRAVRLRQTAMTN